MITLANSNARAIVRETGFSYRGRNIVVRLEVGGKLIRFRPKKQRRWHTATIQQCYWLAVQNTADELRRAKIAAKKAKKEARS